MSLCCFLVVSTWFGIATDGGDDGIRTHDPLLAGQVLSQLSYTPKGFSSSEILFLLPEQEEQCRP